MKVRVVLDKELGTQQKADQDSDSGYTTNNPAIVEHARKCYLNYPTIVNNIPKEKNVYKNTPGDFAKLDSNLAKSQIDIGSSSNLAQIAQTYSCNFADPKYDAYTCILSVLAQVAIDNAKRRFDINLTEEIQRIKKDMDIKTNKYPNFWKIIKKGFNASNINPNLNCPMNYLYDLKLDKYREIDKSLPMSYFFNKFELDVNRKTCKKVEDLITKYSFDLSQFHIDSASTSDSSEEYLLFRSDFEVLIRDIQKTYISGNYVGLMSWLIDRAFIISPSIKQNNASLKSTMNKNKPLLLKVLYDVNKGNLLKCFSKNLTF